MATTEWKDDFIESYVKIGVEQGLEQGLEQGREQGAATAKAQAVLKVLDARGLGPSAKQRARVVASAGLGQLDRWFERALTAVTADDVFKADDVVEEARAD